MDRPTCRTECSAPSPGHATLAACRSYLTHESLVSPSDTKLASRHRRDLEPIFRTLHLGQPKSFFTLYGKEGRHPGGGHMNTRYSTSSMTTRHCECTCPLPGAPPQKRKKRHRVSPSACPMCLDSVRRQTRVFTRVQSHRRMKHTVRITSFHLISSPFSQSPSVLIFSRLPSTHGKGRN